MTQTLLNRQRVADALMRRAAGRWWLAVLQIGTGVLASLLIPFLVACFWAIVNWNRGAFAGRNDGVSFFLDVVICYALFLPIVYVVEWRTNSADVLARLQDMSADAGGWYEAVFHSRRWRWEARQSTATWEVMLFAPRMVFGGAAKLRAARLVAGTNMDHAAAVLAELVSAGHGLAVAQLEGARAQQMEFGRAMAYLLFYEWVGISADGKKVWALSETCEFLNGGSGAS